MQKITVSAGKKDMQFLMIDREGEHDISASVAEGGQLDVVLLEKAPRDAKVSMILRAALQADATIHWHIITLGGSHVTKKLETALLGDRAVSNVDWIFYAKDDENFDLSVRNIFAARDCSGEIIVKGVAEDEAYVKCDGMIDIELTGGGTDTYLTEDVLMLDPTAKIDAIPSLNIKTNDVKASHSATVSKVSSEDLFYFASRGIDEDDARQMYIQGYLGDLLQKISDQKIRDSVLSSVEQKYKAHS